MSFTLRQLRYFVAAAETGRMTGAAVQCGVSQSAVTIALRELEQHLGTPLMIRHQSGVDLTDDGHRFLKSAREILAAVADASRVVRSEGESERGTLTIGVSYTVMGYFIGPHVLRFGRRFAGVSLKLVQYERSELEMAVADGEIDLAVLLVSNVSHRSGISTQLLQASPRRLWLSPGHELLSRRTVGLEDVAQYPYVMLTVDEADETTRKYWKRHEIQPNVVLSTSSVEAVRSFVAGGLGVTILSDVVYRPWSLENERIEQRNIDDVIPSLDIGIAWKSQRPWSAQVRDFVHLLEASVPRPNRP